ncbi:hypothetical protein CBP14_21125 [Fischerella thermalis WC245]|nr:hypothetical protein CBP14_21125 [Fischerella thermalis WC245]
MIWESYISNIIAIKFQSLIRIYLALLNQDMNLQFTGMTRRRDVALLRLTMIWHRTTKMYAHIIHDQIQQRQ